MQNIERIARVAESMRFADGATLSNVRTIVRDLAANPETTVADIVAAVERPWEFADLLVVDEDARAGRLGPHAPAVPAHAGERREAMSETEERAEFRLIDQAGDPVSDSAAWENTDSYPTRRAVELARLTLEPAYGPLRVQQAQTAVRWFDTAQP